MFAAASVITPIERDDMTLQEAQLAKIDLSLGKLGLQPGMTLLDAGCGWGSTMVRAVEKYDVNVIGLTLSQNQKTHIEGLFAASDSPRSKRVLLCPWEEFNEPVDRVVSIGAVEHFGFAKYDFFFKKTYDLMPDGGVMLLHTIVSTTKEEVAQFGCRRRCRCCASSSSSSPRSFRVAKSL
jgi:cyclopropane-fatty-acyl-phospholipid synthase